MNEQHKDCMMDRFKQTVEEAKKKKKKKKDQRIGEREQAVADTVYSLMPPSHIQKA